MKIEEVEKELRDFSYGQLVNTKKYLELEYSKAETLKNALLTGLNNDKFIGDKKQAEDTVNELYRALQRIEDRALLVEKLKGEKEVRY